MSGSATVTSQVGSSCFNASVRARAAARWPPPVSLKRMRTLGEPPFGVGIGAGAAKGTASARCLLAAGPCPVRDPPHVVLGQQECDEDHADDPDGDPKNRSLRELSWWEGGAAGPEPVLLNYVGGQVLDVLVGQVAVAAFWWHRDWLWVARLGLAAGGDDADEEGGVERVGHAWQLVDRVEHRSDAALQVPPMAGRAVLTVELAAFGRVSG